MAFDLDAELDKLFLDDPWPLSLELTRAVVMAVGSDMRLVDDDYPWLIRCVAALVAKAMPMPGAATDRQHELRRAAQGVIESWRKDPPKNLATLVRLRCMMERVNQVNMNLDLIHTPEYTERSLERLWRRIEAASPEGPEPKRDDERD